MPISIKAEWANQSAVILTWPHHHTDWKSSISETEQFYVDVVNNITQYQKVLIICYDGDHHEHIETNLKSQVNNSDNLLFTTAHTNDTWVRDYGPLFQFTDNNVTLLDFQFNGWGNKFQAKLDNKVNSELYRQGFFHNTCKKELDFILEGGALEFDGLGTVMLTKNSFLAKNRNNHLNQSEIENVLKKEFGVTRTLWIEFGKLYGDDTDDHIDMLARFCSPDTIAYSICQDHTDAQFASLEQMKNQLSTFRNHENQRYNLVPLPTPPAIYDRFKNRLPASYANFLIINGAVLLPAYGHYTDQIAVDVLTPVFPGREIISINCLALIQQGGSLHCATMQIPAPVQVK